MRTVAVLVYAICCIYMMLRLWSDPVIERGDSGAYVMAAKTFAESGEMTLNINYPTMTMTIQRNPYTEWMPGLPLLYAPAMRLSSDPYAAALTVQLVFVSLFYLALYGLAAALQLPPLPAAGLALALTFTAPFAYVGRAFISELPLAVCWLVVLWATLRHAVKRAPGYLYLAWAAVVAGALLRFNGPAIAAPLLWLLLARREWRRLIVTAGLALLPAVLWYARNNLLYGVTSFTHDTHALTLSNLIPPAQYAASLLTHPLLLIPFSLVLLWWIARDRRRDTQLLVVALIGQAVVFGLLTVYSAYPFAPRHAFGIALAAIVLAYVGAARSGLRAVALLLLMTLPALSAGPVSLTRYTPPEQALWQRLHQTHPGLRVFISPEGNMVHQWYTDAFALTPWHGEAVTGLVITGMNGAFTVTNACPPATMALVKDARPQVRNAAIACVVNGR